jgi:hypothetical protein
MVFVLIEKVMPYAGIVSRVAGLVAIGAGIMGTLPPNLSN